VLAGACSQAPGLLAVHHTVIAVEQFTNLNILENRMNPYRFSRYTLELQIDNLVVFEAKNGLCSSIYVDTICCGICEQSRRTREQSCATLQAVQAAANRLVDGFLPFSAYFPNMPHFGLVGKAWSA